MLLMVPLTKSTAISTRFWPRPGTPVVTFAATILKNSRKTMPSTTENPRVSTLTAQKPISAISVLLCAMPQVPSAR